MLAKKKIMDTKDQIDDIREKILEGLKIAYEKLIEMKRKNGSVLVISDKGEIIKIKPEKK